ncbi:tyrosinase [Penicillium malachiteum]|uniref:tyrosinase n=1 Tax=Penicillium malachiteum TaxID=1324776 RepID=UPI0025465B18|nr:tyrosinase [Penicillium malachiteum]KAJ5721861.1 tyrosinase [Penicillium malachiteum]
MLNASTQLEKLSHNALTVSINRIIDSPSQKNTTSCTLENLRVRRNWIAFTPSEKRSYIESVHCMTELPAIMPHHLAPGARSRFDDFVAVHINQSYHVHRDARNSTPHGLFFAWHRYFIYEFEQALRNECNYTGDYPYWDWAADADDIEKSEVFDGSDTSLSGNGALISDKRPIGARIPGPYPPLWLPPGTGGGCVTSGPFVNLSVNLGPSWLDVPGDNITRMSNPLDYNPRCLKRDLTTAILQMYVNYTSIIDLIYNSKIIWDLEDKIQGKEDSPGLHGGGHFAMGGDPGRDADASAGDPAFYHHHGMVDRIWWIWQNMDWKNRRYAISGTSTFMDVPHSPNVTLDYLLDVGYANGNKEPIAMRDLMSTTNGPFCYVYL